MPYSYEEYLIGGMKVRIRRRAKVTLLAVTTAFTLSVANADDLLTTSGKRYENIQVTEITPVSIRLSHATGVTCVPFSELDPEVRRKYGYDEAKASACVSQIAEEQRQQAVATEKARLDAIRNYAKTKAELEQMQQLLHAVHDAATGCWYPSEEAASGAREQALKDTYGPNVCNQSDAVFIDSLRAAARFAAPCWPKSGSSRKTKERYFDVDHLKILFDFAISAAGRNPGAVAIELIRA